MKKTSKTEDNKGIWSKVYLIEGEPTGCALVLEELKDTLKSKVVRVNDVESLKPACQAFQFGSTGTIVLVQSPKAEMLAALLEVANSPNSRCNALVVYYPGAYADRRTAFVSEANKRKRNYEYLYHIVNDHDAFREQLSDWESRSGVKIAVKAKPWLIEHAPVKKVDVRGAKGSKEEMVYDIPSLESDLDKLAGMALGEGRDILSVDDLMLGVYTSSVDSQWDYCDAFITGSAAILSMSMPDQSYVGATRMLASQCQFASQVIAHGDKAIENSDAVAAQIGGADFAAKYSFLGGSSEGYKKTHPFRVKMAARKFKNVSLQRVLSLLELCNTATQDMLSGHQHSTVYDMMILASLNQMQYCKLSK